MNEHALQKEIQEAIDGTGKYSEQEDSRKLGDRHEEFCQQYVRLFSVPKAYEAAGYKQGESAKQNCWKLYKKPHIQKRIRELFELRREQMDVSVMKVVEAFQRIAKTCEDEGNFASALRAYENLAKYLGMFTEKYQIEQRTGAQKDEAEIDAEIKRLLGMTKTQGEA